MNLLRRVTPESVQDLNDQDAVRDTKCASEQSAAHRMAVDCTDVLDTQRTCTSASAEGYFRCSPTGELAEVNLAMARMFGYCTPEQMIRELGSGAMRLYVDQEHAQRIHSQLDREGYIPQSLSEVYRRDGSRIWILESAHSVYDEQGEIDHHEGKIIALSEIVVQGDVS